MGEVKDVRVKRKDWWTNINSCLTTQRPFEEIHRKHITSHFLSSFTHVVPSLFSPFPSVCRFFRPKIFDRQEIFHFFPLLDIKMGCNGQMGRGEEIIITNMRKLYVRYEADLIMINEDLKSWKYLWPVNGFAFAHDTST